MKKETFLDKEDDDKDNEIFELRRIVNEIEMSR